MERALSLQGLGRKLPEAPVEYMLRVLAEMPDGREPVYGLTELFEEARYGHHRILASSRETALQALSSVRGMLRSAT